MLAEKFEGESSSMKEIKLSSEVTIEEVALWDCLPSTSICFVINKASGFGHLTEGLALSKLRFLQSKASNVIARLTYEIGQLDQKHPKLEG